METIDVWDWERSNCDLVVLQNQMNLVFTYTANFSILAHMCF